MLKNFFLVCEFEVLALWNDKASLLRLLLDPLAYLLFLGAGLSASIEINAHQHSINYISFVYPGIVALQILRLFTHSIMRLTIDRRWGLQALKISAGTSRLGYLLGMSAIPLLLFLFQTLISYPIALYLGATFSIKGFVYLLASGGTAAIFWTLLAVNLTFWITNYSQRDLVLTCLFTPLFLSAPIFYTIENVPDYLQVISHLNPLTYQVEAMRAAYFEFNLLSPSFLAIVFSISILLSLSLVELSKAEFLATET